MDIRLDSVFSGGAVSCHRNAGVVAGGAGSLKCHMLAFGHATLLDQLGSLADKGGWRNQTAASSWVLLCGASSPSWDSQGAACSWPAVVGTFLFGAFSREPTFETPTAFEFFGLRGTKPTLGPQTEAAHQSPYGNFSPGPLCTQL